MKHLVWISALLFVFAGCSTEEQPAATASQPVLGEDQPAEVTTEAATEPAAEVALEVVEESAAEPEPEDEAIMLARADTTAAPRVWQFREGEHYERMVPTQRTLGGADKIEVAELFMYSCPHCLDLEPYINRWVEQSDPGVRFVRIPVVFNAVAKLHAQLHYAAEVLGRNGVLSNPEDFHATVFQEFHRRGNRLTSEAAIQKLFARFGVSADDFSRTWNSFEVDQKLRVAGDLQRRYNIVSVPTIVVNGKYRTSAGTAGSYTKLFELIDELTVREGLR